MVIGSANNRRKLIINYDFEGNSFSKTRLVRDADEKGNWVKETQWQLVRRSGRSFYEPVEAKYRRIKYYGQPAPQVASNKRLFQPSPCSHTSSNSDGKLHEYGWITYDQEQGYLDNFFVHLQKDNSLKGYIVAYGGRRERPRGRRLARDGRGTIYSCRAAFRLIELPSSMAVTGMNRP